MLFVGSQLSVLNQTFEWPVARWLSRNERLLLELRVLQDALGVGEKLERLHRLPYAVLHHSGENQRLRNCQTNAGARRAILVHDDEAEADASHKGARYTIQPKSQSCNQAHMKPS